MTDQNTIATPAEAASLEVGQWVIDINGRQYCLVDTHVGSPQRMWMSPGGMGHTGIEHIAYPLRLADLDEPEDACPHLWGTQECGHCHRCGRVVAEARPVSFDEHGATVLALVAGSSGDGGGIDA